MSNVACTCIIQFCKFYKKLEFAEPRFIIQHLLRHDEQDLKEIAIAPRIIWAIRNPLGVFSSLNGLPHFRFNIKLGKISINLF